MYKLMFKKLNPASCGLMVYKKYDENKEEHKMARTEPMGTLRDIF